MSQHQTLNVAVAVPKCQKVIDIGLPLTKFQSVDMEHPCSPRHPEEFGRAVKPLPQVSCMRVCLPHFRSRVALGRHQNRTAGTLNFEFQSVPSRVNCKSSDDTQRLIKQDSSFRQG